MKAFKHEKRSPSAGGGLPIRPARELEMASPNKSPVKRTSAGLREALFDAIEKVRDGDMVAEDAKAIAALSNQICSTVSLEIQVAKLRSEYPADMKLVLPVPLSLGPSEDEKK